MTAELSDLESELEFSVIKNSDKNTREVWDFSSDRTVNDDNMNSTLNENGISNTPEDETEESLSITNEEKRRLAFLTTDPSEDNITLNPYTISKESYNELSK